MNRESALADPRSRKARRRTASPRQAADARREASGPAEPRHERLECLDTNGPGGWAHLPAGVRSRGGEAGAFRDVPATGSAHRVGGTEDRILIVRPGVARSICGRVAVRDRDRHVPIAVLVEDHVSGARVRERSRGNGVVALPRELELDAGAGDDSRSAPCRPASGSRRCCRNCRRTARSPRPPRRRSGAAGCPAARGRPDRSAGRAR